MTGRAIVVTGAGRGIGKAVAQAFAASGDRVAIHYRTSARQAEELRGSLPGDGHTIVQADPDSVRAIVDRAAEVLAGLDVLVNNAGVYAPHAVLASSYEEWQQRWLLTLDTNLVGAANAIWCAVRPMPAGGRIVNVSSRGAFRGEPNHVAYGASKAGLNAHAVAGGRARRAGDRHRGRTVSSRQIIADRPPCGPHCPRIPAGRTAD